jgi:2-methylcitrate dehydratase PrpD
MRRVSFSIDPRLDAYTDTGFPAAMTVRTRSGQVLTQDMLQAPGSPLNRLTDHQLGDKLRRLAPPAFLPSHLDALERTIFELPQLPDISGLGLLLRGEAQN